MKLKTKEVISGTKWDKVNKKYKLLAVGASI